MVYGMTLCVLFFFFINFEVNFVFNYRTEDSLVELISALPFLVKGIVLDSGLFLGHLFRV